MAIGYHVPEHAGIGLTGETIGILRKALDKGHGLAGLTDNQRRRWIALRDHNRHDCAGMRRVSLQAARELAADEAVGMRSRAARLA